MTSIYVLTYTCMSVQYACTCTCIYIRTCTCTYVYIHVHVYNVQEQHCSLLISVFMVHLTTIIIICMSKLIHIYTCRYCNIACV